MNRAALLALAAIAVVAALVFARPHPTPGPPMRDFEAYYAAGALWNHANDPYSQAIWRAEQPLAGVDAGRYEALPFAGPPVLRPLLGALARLPFAAANTLWRAFLIAALAGLALLVVRIAEPRINAFSCLAIAVAALGFGPLTSALALGQIALPAFLFAVLSLTWPPAQFFAWMQPNVGLTLLWQVFSRRIPIFAASAAAFAIGCVLAIGPGGLAHYIAVLHLHAASEQFSAIQLTPAAIAYGFGAPPALAASIGTAVAIAAICCWALLMRTAREGAARFASTCALLPLAMPFFHEHDLLVLFFPAIFYAVRANERTWPLAACGALLAATDWLGLAQRPDGTVQTLLLVGAFGAALIALRERPHARMLAVPAAALACIAAAAAFAHTHPAPIWPDAMHALPRGVANTGIASAWQAEQRATGLFARDPVWALLRLFSLTGCVLLCAAAVSSRCPADSRTSSPAPA